MNILDQAILVYFSLLLPFLSVTLAIFHSFFKHSLSSLFPSLSIYIFIISFKFAVTFLLSRVIVPFFFLFFSAFYLLLI